MQEIKQRWNTFWTRPCFSATKPFLSQVYRLLQASRLDYESVCRPTATKLGRARVGVQTSLVDAVSKYMTLKPFIAVTHTFEVQRGLFSAIRIALPQYA